MFDVRNESDEPEAESIPRAALRAGIGKTSLWLAISRGELATVRVGRRRLIRVETLRAWLRDLERTDQS